ncbi:hypothetical protein J3R82DRAFT_5497, partial [Butyriboletus roseoflavus]
PWSIRWMKAQVENTDVERSIHHLKSFVHNSRTIEVSRDLMQDLQRLSDEDAYWVLHDLQHVPKFWKASPRSTKQNLLETPVKVTLANRQTADVKALIDSGCTGSSIHEKFVTEKGVKTYPLPRPLTVYNADGTPNAGGKVEKFVILELQVNNHKKQLALAVTNLG